MKETALKLFARLRDDKRFETLVYALLAVFAAAAFLMGGGLDCGGRTDRAKEESAPVSAETQLESRLESILSQIEGAGKVRVMISFCGDDGNSVRGAIVVAEGARDIGVRMELERAAATALGTELAAVNVFAME